jgi:hypothetical protein
MLNGNLGDYINGKGYYSGNGNSVEMRPGLFVSN